MRSTGVSKREKPNVADWVVRRWHGPSPKVPMKSTASGLQRPPVSRATTTNLHLSPWRSSEYWPPCTRRHPPLHRLGEACLWLSLWSDVRRQLSPVDEWQTGREHLHRSRIVGTAMLMSTNFALKRTDAPASRHSLASVRSGAAALVRNLPEWGHAALCRPWSSRIKPHSHLASDTGNGSRNLSKKRVRKRSGAILNWGLRRTGSGHDRHITTLFLWWYSAAEDAKCCQP